MFTARVLYGTESGNAEMVADDVAALLVERGFEVEPEELSDVDPATLEPGQFVFLISSTYEEGELPASAQPFHEALLASQPDLGGLHVFGFGLGDSSYEHYARGIDTLTAALASAGAIVMGDNVKHDALTGTDPAEAGVVWAGQALDAVLSSAIV
ncbi:nitric oxide synthase [Brachybacterium sp. SGAir0954]|uniref:flavodoxin domain-containing protein n=1 Tax=Brachybacterium sp. SGAir0954 TaxID=2571029 RepID=UPI0010CCEE64|nr:flavodoxin domain-containing protein [Brachybacterium sp. SGAir0954]QCR52247.1 nitric oxide synthase [Brachybacterium sp. SGAir0954]